MPQPPEEGRGTRARLVAAAVERNRSGWVRLALRITGNLQDAEDAVQEAITRVLQGPGSLPDEDAAGRYLTRTVSHCAIDRVRARAQLTSFTRVAEHGPRPAQVPPDQEERLLAAEEAAARAREVRRILAAVARLPEPQRQAVELLLLRHPPLKLREASELTGVPISTLHSRLQAALGRLRAFLWENSEKRDDER